MIKTSLTSGHIDYNEIDRLVAKGRRERSKALAAMVKALFSSPAAADTPADTPVGDRLIAKARAA